MLLSRFGQLMMTGSPGATTRSSCRRCHRTERVLGSDAQNAAPSGVLGTLSFAVEPGFGAFFAPLLSPKEREV